MSEGDLVGSRLLCDAREELVSEIARCGFERDAGRFHPGYVDGIEVAFESHALGERFDEKGVLGRLAVPGRMVKVRHTELQGELVPQLVQNVQQTYGIRPA
jgi:hypothetical protein